jgi:hypothetical protein
MNHNFNNNRARRRVHLHREPKYSWQKRQSAAISQLDLEIQARLGRKLRVSYEELVNEPIPDRFIKLLNELKKWER